MDDYPLIVVCGLMALPYPTNAASVPELPAETVITNGIAPASRINDDLAVPLVAV
ncbi:hypothetical protein H6F89_04800 [Cyanobacteria bacterium FACHB-63]|nr:hypothetical protein [Cyanobacteria bacterium FACHB-63]